MTTPHVTGAATAADEEAAEGRIYDVAGEDWDKIVAEGDEERSDNEQIVVTVYNNNKIDGDRISLYYGDSCIVQNYKLTGKKKSFAINIDKAHPKQLILFAVNQGTMPPNTAAVTVGDGRNETNVVLSSDMKNCDSVMLVYKDE